MNITTTYKKHQPKLNLILILIFFLIFIYYLNYPFDSSKSIILNLGVEQELKNRYLIWGYINDYIFKLSNLILGNIVPSIFLMSVILAFQVASIWAFTIYQIKKELNIFAIIIFFHPFVLDWFCLCTRDSIVLAIFYLIAFKSWNKFKLLLSILLSAIHIGILPLILATSFIYLKKQNTKYYFVSLAIISILFSLIVHIILRYTDMIYLLPDGIYREPLLYPRLGYLAPDNIQNLVNLAYNFYGNINYKILCFGFIGQLITILFKNNFPKNSFTLSFSVFFVCTALSSIPNADRFLYHAILISFPYFLYFSQDYIKKLTKPIKGY